MKLTMRIVFDPLTVSLKDLNETVVKLGVKQEDISWTNIREAKVKDKK